MRYFTTEPTITFEAARYVSTLLRNTLSRWACPSASRWPTGPVIWSHSAAWHGAPLLSAQIAQDKAYSVAAFGGVPTHQWWTMIADEPPLLHGIVKTDRLIVFGGGVPVRADGALIGAVGVSGGSARQDQAVAEAGAAALGV